MGLHTHLHTPDSASVTEESAKHGVFMPFVEAFAIIGMFLTLIGNVAQTAETFDFLVQNVPGGSFLACIPTSFYFTVASDAFLVAYGAVGNNLIVAVYGIVNSSVVFFTMYEIYASRRRRESEFPAEQAQCPRTPNRATF